MFLYTTGIEELFVQISKNEKIIGCTVPSAIPRTIKLTEYMDDIGGTFENTRVAWFLFQEFKNCDKLYGASVNDDKTKILAIYSKFSWNHF